MIFVTVGTQEAPFDRLLKSLETQFLGKEVMVQHGHTSVPPWFPHQSRPFLAAEEYQFFLSHADLVVTHGGVGSIMDALTLAVPIIVVPRKKRYKEHVDDHQRELAMKFQRMNWLWVVEDPDRLSAFWDEHKGDKLGRFVPAPTKLISSVRALFAAAASEGA